MDDFRGLVGLVLAKKRLDALEEHDAPRPDAPAREPVSPPRSLPSSSSSHGAVGTPLRSHRAASVLQSARKHAGTPVQQRNRNAIARHADRLHTTTTTNRKRPRPFHRNMHTPRHTTIATHDGRTLGKGNTAQQQQQRADKHAKSTNLRTTRAQTRAAAEEENVDTSNTRGDEKPVWKGKHSTRKLTARKPRAPRQAIVLDEEDEEEESPVASNRKLSLMDSDMDLTELSESDDGEDDEDDDEDDVKNGEDGEAGRMSPPHKKRRSILVEAPKNPIVSVPEIAVATPVPATKGRTRKLLRTRTPMFDESPLEEDKQVSHASKLMKSGGQALFSPSARKKSSRSALKIVRATKAAPKASAVKRQLDASLAADSRTSKISKSPVSKAFFKHLLMRTEEDAKPVEEDGKSKSAEAEVVDGGHEESVDMADDDKPAEAEAEEEEAAAAAAEAQAAAEEEAAKNNATPTPSARTPAESSEASSPASATGSQSQASTPASVTSSVSHTSTPTDAPTPTASPVAVAEKGEEDSEPVAAAAGASATGAAAAASSHAVKMSSKIEIPALARARKAKMAAERAAKRKEVLKQERIAALEKRKKRKKEREAQELAAVAEAHAKEVEDHQQQQQKKRKGAAAAHDADAASSSSADDRAKANRDRRLRLEAEERQRLADAREKRRQKEAESKKRKIDAVQAKQRKAAAAVKKVQTTKQHIESSSAAAFDADGFRKPTKTPKHAFAKKGAKGAAVGPAPIVYTGPVIKAPSDDDLKPEAVPKFELFGVPQSSLATADGWITTDQPDDWISSSADASSSSSSSSSSQQTGKAAEAEAPASAFSSDFSGASSSSSSGKGASASSTSSAKSKSAASASVPKFASAWANILNDEDDADTSTSMSSSDWNAPSDSKSQKKSTAEVEASEKVKTVSARSTQSQAKLEDETASGSDMELESSGSLGESDSATTKVPRKSSSSDSDMELESPENSDADASRLSNASRRSDADGEGSSDMELEVGADASPATSQASRKSEGAESDMDLEMSQPSSAPAAKGANKGEVEVEVDPNSSLDASKDSDMDIEDCIEPGQAESESDSPQFLTPEVPSRGGDDSDKAAPHTPSSSQSAAKSSKYGAHNPLRSPPTPYFVSPDGIKGKTGTSSRMHTYVPRLKPGAGIPKDAPQTQQPLSPQADPFATPYNGKYKPHTPSPIGSPMFSSPSPLRSVENMKAKSQREGEGEPDHEEVLQPGAAPRRPASPGGATKKGAAMLSHYFESPAPQSSSSSSSRAHAGKSKGILHAQHPFIDTPSPILGKNARKHAAAAARLNDSLLSEAGTEYEISDYVPSDLEDYSSIGEVDEVDHSTGERVKMMHGKKIPTWALKDTLKRQITRQQEAERRAAIDADAVFGPPTDMPTSDVQSMFAHFHKGRRPHHSAKVTKPQLGADAVNPAQEALYKHQISHFAQQHAHQDATGERR